MRVHFSVTRKGGDEDGALEPPNPQPSQEVRDMDSLFGPVPPAARAAADRAEREALQRYWHDKLIAAVVASNSRRERAAARRSTPLEHWS